MRKQASEFPMTTADVAKYLKLSEHTVRKYVARNLLTPFRKLGPCNLFTKEECDRYKRERRPRGHPVSLKKTG